MCGLEGFLPVGVRRLIGCGLGSVLNVLKRIKRENEKDISGNGTCVVFGRKKPSELAVEGGWDALEVVREGGSVAEGVVLEQLRVVGTWGWKKGELDGVWGLEVIGFVLVVEECGDGGEPFFLIDLRVDFVQPVG